jgi:hypothetical protein
VLGYVIKLLLKKTAMQKYRVYYPVIIAFFLFPLPFFLINFEPRYIWYMLPISMLLGAAILQKKNQGSNLALITIFAASYIIWPVRGIYKMWNDGKAEYEIARQLKANGIAGSYTTNLVYGDAEHVSTQRIAYFENVSFYPVVDKAVTFPQLLQEIRRYHLRYFFYYKNGSLSISEADIQDEAGKPFRQVALKGQGTFKVYEIN